MQMFSRSPERYWGVIRKRLVPYLKKASRLKYGLYACKLMDQMTDMLLGQADSDEPLGAAYLTGFSSQQLCFLRMDYAVRKGKG